jgi:hypothetical protein
MPESFWLSSSRQFSLICEWSIKCGYSYPQKGLIMHDKNHDANLIDLICEIRLAASHDSEHRIRERCLTILLDRGIAPTEAAKLYDDIVQLELTAGIPAYTP